MFELWLWYVHQRLLVIPLQNVNMSCVLDTHALHTDFNMLKHLVASSDFMEFWSTLMETNLCAPLVYDYEGMGLSFGSISVLRPFNTF